MFEVDGLTWRWPCDIAREAEVRPSGISGLMLDKRYFNDVLGTYMAYTVTVAVPTGAGEDYDRLYEALTAPVDGHRFRLPYNRGEIEVTGRVERVRDAWVRLPGGGIHWKGVSFEIVANHPSREMSLGETLALGRAAVPMIANPDAGDCYRFDGGVWVREEWVEGDEVYY